MRDELVRSTDTLQLEELERPYFIEYAVVDTELTVIEATFGASVRNDQTHMRSLRVDVRVGSHELDNSEFVAGPSFIRIGRFPRNLVRDDDYDALRHDLWLATDAAYKEGLGAACAEACLPPEPGSGRTRARLFRRGGFRAGWAPCGVRVRCGGMARDPAEVVRGIQGVLGRLTNPA